MGNDTHRAVLYGNGLLASSDATKNATELAAVRSSGFTTVVLWTLHVGQNGEIFYNDKDKPLADGGKITPQLVDLKLKEQIAELKRGGSVTNVLFGIGSGGVADFGNIEGMDASTYETFVANLKALSDYVQIDGYDFDMEEEQDPGMADLLVKLTLLIGKEMGRIVTYCPYYNEEFWTGCLKAVYDQPDLGVQYVRWFNLQCYSGGAGNDPEAWIRGIPSDVGVEDPASFIVPGYGCLPGGSSPDDVEQTLEGMEPRPGGCFIWNSGDVFANAAPGAPTVEEYGQAILEGLGPSPSVLRERTAAYLQNTDHEKP